MNNEEIRMPTRVVRYFYGVYHRWSLVDLYSYSLSKDPLTMDKILSYLSFMFLAIFIMAGILTLNFFGSGFALIVFGAYFVISTIAILSLFLLCLLISYCLERNRYGGKHKRSIFLQILQKLQTLKARGR